MWKNTENKKESKTQEKSNTKSNEVIKSYRFGDFMSWFSIQKFIERYKENHIRSRLFLIIMQLRNDKYAMFTVATKEKYFTYQNANYIIDPDMSREDIHTRLSTLFYHQDCTAPFKISFDISKLKMALRKQSEESTGTDNVEKTINPQNIKSFIDSQVIEKVLKGQELSDDIKFLRMLLIINLLITLGLAFLIAKSTGMIS